MKNKFFLFTGAIILLTSFISAYSYNSASISSLFEAIGGENLGLMIVWAISFALISVILNRTGFFGENKGASSVISLMISIGITYGFYRQGISFDISNIFYSFGFSDYVLDLIVFFAIIILAIVLLVKLKSGAILLIGGLILALGIILGLGIEVILIGIALIIIWGIMRAFGFWADRVYFGWGGTRGMGRRPFGRRKSKHNIRTY